jgi:hypothetical protein
LTHETNAQREGRYAHSFVSTRREVERFRRKRGAKPRAPDPSANPRSYNRPIFLEFTARSEMQSGAPAPPKVFC